jgi:hypothetical protein
MEAALPAICDAIQQPSILPNMRLLARQLSADGAEVSGSPNEQADVLRLCRVLLLDEHAGDAAREALGENFERQAPWLRAIVHLAAGDEGLELWQEDEAYAMEDRAVLRSLLGKCLDRSPYTANQVLEACRLSFATEQVREHLALDFAAFNRSLAATGSAPDTDAPGQLLQVGHYVAEHELSILQALRNRSYEKLSKFEPDADYARLHNQVRQLAPNPDWLMIHLRIPEEELAMLLQDWLEGVGAPPLGTNPHNLPSVTAVRDENNPIVRKFTASAAPLVRAWCIKIGHPLHPVWANAADVETSFRAAIDGAGAYDFLPLDEASLLRWSASLGLWPENMEQTLSREKLGIPKDELEAIKQKQLEEQARREALARSVTFGGKPVDPRNADWDAISAQIAAQLPRSVRNMPVGTMADLLPGQGGGRRGSAGGGGGGPFAGIPQEKKDMIGRLGELSVYHWLKARLKDQDIDQAWVSSNASFVTGRPGDDSRGYDFKVEYRRQTWFVEVKASTSDPRSFEMGESEVRLARELARPRTAERYVVAYVANVGSPCDLAIQMLPNPMSAEADGLLDIVGQGLRYRFTPRT